MTTNPKNTVPSQKKRLIKARQRICELRAIVAVLELDNFRLHQMAEFQREEIQCGRARERWLISKLKENQWQQQRPIN